MMSKNVGDVNATNAILQGGDGGEPIVTYKKAIRGKVFVNVWDTFLESPEGLMLYGEEGSETSIYDIWNTKELRYFELRNKRLLETGYLIKYTRKEPTQEISNRKEALTDEQLTKVLKDKFFTLQSFLADVDSVPVIYRMLVLAEELGKPAKTIDFIKSKLSDVQSFVPLALQEEEE